MIGKPTLSSFLHGLIALVVSAAVYFPGLILSEAWSYAAAGTIFFYAREMTSYQYKREARGDGKANRLQLKDLNPVTWARDGQSDGFWDFAIPAVACVAGAVALAIWR